MLNVGFRSHKVLTGTSGSFDTHGAYVYAEVTNAGGTDTVLYPNYYGTNDGEFENGVVNGIASDGITIPANSVREIPLQLYNFKADAAVTVLAYRR